MIFQYLKLNKSEFKYFLYAFLASLLARGVVLFNLSYAIDDYSYMFTHITLDRNCISFGRWGLGIVNDFFFYLGIEGPYAFPFVAILSFLTLAYVSVLICRMWDVKGFWACILVSLFFILHPYQSEIYTFRIASISFFVALLFAFTSFYLAGVLKRRLLFLPIMLFVFSLSVYQIVLNYVFVVYFFSLIVFLLFKQNERRNRESLFSQFILLIGGTFVYFIVNKLILYLTQIETPKRAEFVTFDQIPDRVKEISLLVFGMFYQAESILPFLTKILLLLFLLLFIFSVSIFLLKKKLYLKLALFIFVFILAYFSTIGVNMMNGVWWPAPRVLASVGIFWGGILAITYKLKMKLILKISLTLSIVVLFSFVGVNNKVFVDQIRINKFDFSSAIRITSLLEKQPNFSPSMPLYIDGRIQYTYLPVTMMYDMNVSALLQPWSKVSLLNESVGYSFLQPNPMQVDIGRKACEDAAKWPSEKSVFVVEGVGVVCL
ncbi:glucosyltransferase domain-containing protein [Patescibacteria group bacterium]|nr:glucosyltransferase domain-containing protein [Patescibacteria group bacterium]